MDLYDHKGNKIKNAYLSFKDTTITERPSFTEYLKGGWKINMSVAIDYTASNGHPGCPSSLHFVSEKDQSGSRPFNDYEQAMESVGKILETYAYKKRFSCYGFGGIKKNMGPQENKDKFYLGTDDAGNARPEIDGYLEMLNAYR